MRAMGQPSASAKNSTIIEGATVRSCELRLERRTKDAHGQEQMEYLCGASGGPEQGDVLGVAGEDLSSMIAICNACPIPDALESRCSCLNLVPVRRFPGGKRSLPMVQSHVQTTSNSGSVDTYFPCRWFYSLYRQNQPRDLSVCQSCPYWFPRPPRELIPNYWPETQKMLRVVNGEEATSQPPTGFTPTSRQPAETWWQRIRQKIHL